MTGRQCYALPESVAETFADTGSVFASCFSRAVASLPLIAAWSFTMLPTGPCPKAGPAVADNDCKIWSNVQSELCFNCQSCRTPLLDELHFEWKLCSITFFVCSVQWCIRRGMKSNDCQKRKVCSA